MATAYAWLAAIADLVHTGAMIVWALGLPLLFWHRWPRPARIYVWYALSFTVISFVSHELIGECFLTTFARELRRAAGVQADTASFTIRLVNFVAGIRPGERSIVVAWQIAIFVTSLGALAHLWHTRGNRTDRSGGGERSNHA